MAAVADKATRSLEEMAAVDLGAARATLDDLIQSDAFLETLREPGATFPIMLLDDSLRAAIGADAHVVRLSSDTYAKQLGLTSRSLGHPELTIDDYRMLPKIGSTPDRVLVDGDTRLILMKADDGRYRIAVLKSADGGREMYLLSYRWANARDVARLVARLVELRI